MIQQCSEGDHCHGKDSNITCGGVVTATAVAIVAAATALIVMTAAAAITTAAALLTEIPQ